MIGEVLMQDIGANFALIQFMSLVASGAIALTGAVLAARAGAMLSEARQLYAEIKTLTLTSGELDSEYQSSDRLQRSLKNISVSTSRRLPEAVSRRVI